MFMFFWLWCGRGTAPAPALEPKLVCFTMRQSQTRAHPTFVCLTSAGVSFAMLHNKRSPSSHQRPIRTSGPRPLTLDVVVRFVNVCARPHVEPKCT